MTDVFYTLALYLALLSSLLILIRRQWTLNLITLTVQFLCLFPVLRSFLPLQVAIIQPNWIDGHIDPLSLPDQCGRDQTHRS